MLRAIWSSVYSLFGLFSQGQGEDGGNPLSDLGHEMDPDG